MAHELLLLQVCAACFTIQDVYLIDMDNYGPNLKTGLRDGGDLFSPAETGCNRIPCGLGTNDKPDSDRVFLNLVEDPPQRIGARIAIQNDTYTGVLGAEFRYGNNPTFDIGSAAFDLSSQPVLLNADQQLSFALQLSPSFTANATIQFYFVVNEGDKNETFYQCIDLHVLGEAPLPPWAADFGPDEEQTYTSPPSAECGSTCEPSFWQSLSPYTWLVVLCGLAFLTLVISLIVFCLCFRRKKPDPILVVSRQAEIPVSGPQPKERREASVSVPSHYIRYNMIDPHESSSGKPSIVRLEKSSGTGRSTGTGSPGRHFHFHYEETDLDLPVET